MKKLKFKTKEDFCKNAKIGDFLFYKPFSDEIRKGIIFKIGINYVYFWQPKTNFLTSILFTSPMKQYTLIK